MIRSNLESRMSQLPPKKLIRIHLNLHIDDADIFSLPARINRVDWKCLDVLLEQEGKRLESLGELVGSVI